MQVLVVDDEIAIVDLLADILGDEGYEVIKAHDGQSALLMLRAGLRPRVAIVDLMMPHLDGMGLYHAIRSEFANEPIGVLLMSAGKKVQPPDPHAEFMSKPFGVNEVLDLIDTLA